MTGHPQVERWSYRAEDPARYLICVDGEPVGETFWIRVLRHPSNTMTRLVAGLNIPPTQVGHPHVGAVTPRWAFVPTSAGRYDLFFDGAQVGEIAWTVPVRHPDQLVVDAVAGLNGIHIVPVETAVA